MRLIATGRLAAQHLTTNPGRNLLSAMGIGVGVCVLLLIAGLGLGARDIVLKEVMRELPVDIVEVIPKSVDLGLFQMGEKTLFGEAARLDDKALDALRALPEVQNAYPKLEVKLPMGAHGGARFFGRRLYTDLFMTGLDEALLRERIPAFRDAPDVLPVVVSDQLLAIYNASVAPNLGTPKLSPETLTGFMFEVQIGRSLMLGNRGVKRVGDERARVVGTSPFAMRLGVSVPLATARRLLNSYALEPKLDDYQAILLRATSVADLPEIKRKVEALGFSIDASAQKTSRLMGTATLLASLLGILVLLLAALNIAHGFFASLSERRRELATLRAVGATRGDVVSLVLTQAFFLGIFGGLGGVIAALGITNLIDWAALRFVADLPFSPRSFFALPLWLVFTGLSAAILASVVGALWPAISAARAPVAAALADGG